MAGFYDNTYNPDVLLCLANLSNDEVFTPPDVANQILDMLPQELFSDPNTKFLDPACKSGVFLREIAKRLIVGLANTIPDLQERIDHIMHKQLYAIAITELTAMLSRRSVYCSKYPNGPFAVSHFETAQGNIKFHKISHTWKDGKCVYCGASQSEYDRDASLETHAYEFIHFLKPEEIFNMKFDVIVSNPPYQISDGGNGASAKPIYHLFVQQAKKLNPRYMTMIIPARWYSGGKGLDEFRSEMLHDREICELTDFFDSVDCFPGVDISGGICYFLWHRENNSDCRIISHRGKTTTVMVRPLIENATAPFIRFNEAVEIYRKVSSHKEKVLSEIVSSRKPFGLPTNPKGINSVESKDNIKIYAYPKSGYIARSEIAKNIDLIDKYKVCDAKAYGERGNFPYTVLAKPFLAEPNSCCSETYIVIGSFDTEMQAKNLMSYIATKFFRFMVLLQKNTQDAPQRVYSLVPIQDFSKPWSDEELYKKYNLTDDEIAFIESMIKPMDLNGGDT